MFAPVGFYVTAQNFLDQLSTFLRLPPGAPLMNDGRMSLHFLTLPFSLRLRPGSLLSSSSPFQMTPWVTRTLQLDRFLSMILFILL